MDGHSLSSDPSLTASLPPQAPSPPQIPPPPEPWKKIVTIMVVSVVLVIAIIFIVIEIMDLKPVPSNHSKNRNPFVLFSLPSPQARKCTDSLCGEQFSRLTKYGCPNCHDLCGDFIAMTCCTFKRDHENKQSNYWRIFSFTEKQNILDDVNSKIEKILANSSIRQFEAIHQMYHTFSRAKGANYSSELSEFFKPFKAKSNWTQVLNLSMSYGQIALFNLDIRPSVFEESTYSFYLSPPKFLAHRNMVVQAKKDDAINQKMNHLYLETLKRFDPTVKWDNLIQALVKLETKLARGTRDLSRSQNSKSSALYRRMTFEELETTFGPELNITEIVNGLMSLANVSKRVSVDDHLIVFDYAYFSSLSNVLKKTSQKNSSTVANYIIARTILSLAFLEDDYILNLGGETPFDSVTFNRKVDRFIDFLRQIAPHHLTTLYKLADNSDTKTAQNESKWQENVQMIKRMADYIRNEIKVKLFDLTLLPHFPTDLEADVQKLLGKLDNLIVHIGHPVWVDNWDKSDELLQLYQGDSALESAAALEMMSLMAKSNKLDKKFARDEWFTSSASVDVHYDFETNCLFIPDGIINWRLFDSLYPSYINYGSLGVIIASEMLKSINFRGLGHNELGLIRKDWISKDFVKWMKNRTRCFAKTFSVSNENFTWIDGKDALDENLAESEGLVVAFDAFKRDTFKGGSFDASGEFSAFSRQNLFFLFYGARRCESTSEEFDYWNPLINRRANNSFRTQVILEQSSVFHRTANCPVSKLLCRFFA